jgi:hypothetical protein
MTRQFLPRVLWLGLLLFVVRQALFPAPAGAAERADPDGLEHRIGLSVGYARVIGAGFYALPQRVDYTLGWRGWGLGAAATFDLRAEGSETVTGAGLYVQRSFVLGSGRLWGSAELGITRLDRSWRVSANIDVTPPATEGEATLYHGTSSGVELGYDFGRAELRPFVSVRANFPWYTTETEKLTRVAGNAQDGGAILVDHFRQWTPIWSFWLGAAW